MNQTVVAPSSVMPSAALSEVDLATWQELLRDEQLRRLQAKLTHPDCSAPSSATMGDILSRAQAAAKLRRGRGGKGRIERCGLAPSSPLGEKVARRAG